jgi:hypothetical protein
VEQEEEGTCEAPTEGTVRPGTVAMPQTEVVASMADAPWPGVVAMSQENMAQRVLPPTRTEEGASETSAKNVEVGQASVPVSPTPGATGQTILKEASPQEGSASPGGSTRPSQVLVHVGSDLHTWGGPRIWWAER